MRISIKPGVARGSATPPSSKSYAHRLVIGASLADGKSVIRGVNLCEDILATLDCASALGTRYSLDGDSVEIRGTAGRVVNEAALPCRDSGSTLRFFIPVALTGGGHYVFSGSRRLIERGAGVYESSLGESGVKFERSPEAIDVTGGLRHGDYILPGDVSSQYVTGLLYALPLLDGDSTITVLPPIESRQYIDITLDVLARFGINIDEPEKNTFRIKGGQTYNSLDCKVEGDWSAAAFLIALGAMGGDVALEGMNAGSVQGDRVFASLLARLDEDKPVVDISDCPDLGPILFACAAYKHGATFTGTRRLRIKESDRAAVMAEELGKFGVRVTVDENSVTVHGDPLVTPSEVLCGHNDHRIVMSLAVLSTVTGGTIDGCEAVSKSYPDFFGTLGQLGLEISYEDK